ncbi:MAG: ABC transporter ATP-binding protein [Gemmatimonadales bacterium]
MSLRATGLTVRYPGASVPALEDVSFALGGGELVAIGGPNGSGKTSLLRALLGLVPLGAGSVTLDDRPIVAWPRRALAGAIAALPQREEPAFPLTVHDAVLLGRWAHLGPVAPVRAADERAIAEAMSRCDVADLGPRGIETLSGGEWQRVRVARALAASPRLLLLDEPTAALDVGHEMALFELLRSLVSEGLGVLVITHQLNLAARFADRMLLLDRGHAVAEGTPREVLSADRLSALFGWPVAVERWHDGSPLLVPLRSGEPPRGPLANLPPTDEMVP